MSVQGARAGGTQNTQNGEYAADVTPTEAWEMLTTNPDAVLVDVRTSAEWCFVGEPDLSSINKEQIRLSWCLFPTMETNPDFVQEFAKYGIAKDAPVLFLCKTGGRSVAAATAITAAGWSNCYNIKGGFEGDPDEHGHRGNINGWKAAALPWRQN